jgi:hypothetical protein
MLPQKYPPFLLSKTMQLVAHTPLGIFKGVDVPAGHEEQKAMDAVLERIHDLEYFGIETKAGFIYMTKAMIDSSIFVLSK